MIPWFSRNLRKHKAVSSSIRLAVKAGFTAFARQQVARNSELLRAGVQSKKGHAKNAVVEHMVWNNSIDQWSRPPGPTGSSVLLRWLLVDFLDVGLFCFYGECFNTFMIHIYNRFCVIGMLHFALGWYLC